jgi:hypothetical protein
MDPGRLKAHNDATFLVAIAIRATDPGEAHTGVAYRDGARLSLLHLAWDRDLRDEPLRETYLCAVPNLPPERARLFPRLCAKIAKNPTSIRFALKDNKSNRFDCKTGRVVLAKEGKGLNCTTFVLSFFRSYGVFLVDFDTWETRASDLDRHKSLVERVAKGVGPYPPDPAHAALIESEPGCARVRPQEAAGACLEDSMPVAFKVCEANGQYVMQQLANAANKPVQRQIVAAAKPHQSQPAQTPPGQPPTQT